MLTDEIKCKICKETTREQIGSELFEARLCSDCEAEYGIDVELCEQCNEEPVTRYGHCMCEKCIAEEGEDEPPSKEQMLEWIAENKQMERDYRKSVL